MSHPKIIVWGETGIGKSAVMEIIYDALIAAGLHPYSDDLAMERRMVDRHPEPFKVWELVECNAARPDPAEALAKALRDMRKRFHSACISTGSDKQFADAACEQADAALAAYEDSK